MIVMLIALILIFFGMFCILFLVGREPVPWTNRLRRVHPGVARKAEWVAPEDVIRRVSHDYLRAMEWLQTASVGEQLQYATYYLTGRFLMRFQSIASYQPAPHNGHFVGMMTARHHVQVRQFSEDGCRCLVVDCQTERRVESRFSNNHEWSLEQDLGDGALVFQMVYDIRAQSWKIEQFVQELPAGWGTQADEGPVRLLSQLPTTSGRDF